MKALIWNVRGLGNKSRVRQLRELIQKEQVDIVGLQETIKQDFSYAELESLAPGGLFSWKWTPAQGHSGGILLGVKQDILQVENWETDDFFVGATIRHILLNVRWDLISVYGPAKHEFSPNFLDNLTRRSENATLPILLGGDFNLIRSSADKKTGGGEIRLMNLFNDFIERCDLREIHRRGGSRFTWTNKQENPTMCNLDRVLVSTDWEEKFPTATLTALTRVGSDHSPLLLDTGVVTNKNLDNFSLKNSGVWRTSLRRQ